GRSLRTNKRSHSAGRRADAAVIPVWPIGGHARSSGRCALHLGTRSRSASCRRWRPDVRSGSGGSFFEPLDRAGVLRRMSRASADMREAERREELADGALVIGDPEALENDALQVDPAPAHHTVHGPVRTGLDELRDLASLLLREAWLRTLGPAV